MTEMEALTAMSSVLDPEVGIDIVSLGLVVDVEITPGLVDVKLIMTSVACPMHADLARQAEDAVREKAKPGTTVTVRVVDSPEWTPDRMSLEARRQLGW